MSNFLIMLVTAISIISVAYALKYILYIADEKKGKNVILMYQDWLRQLGGIGYVFLIGFVLFILFAPMTNTYASWSLRLAGACICVIATLVAFICSLFLYLLISRREVPRKSMFYFSEYLYVLFIGLSFVTLILVGEKLFLSSVNRFITITSEFMLYPLILVLLILWIGSIWIIYKIIKYFL